MFGAFIFSSLSPSRVKKEEQREDCDENIFEEENKKKKVRDWLLVHARGEGKTRGDSLVKRESGPVTVRTQSEYRGSHFVSRPCYRVS